MQIYRHEYPRVENKPTRFNLKAADKTIIRSAERKEADYNSKRL